MSAHKETAAAPAAPAKSGGSLLGKLMIAGFMGGVVAVECLLAYFFIPSADEVAAIAEQNMAKKLPVHIETEEHEAAHDEHLEEIDLGKYAITAPQRNTHTALRVDFHLVGTVKTEDASEIEHLVEENSHRIRELVLYEIRNSEPEDLQDPGLALIKRRILEKSNALFGTPILKSVLFSEFSYFEQ